MAPKSRPLFHASHESLASAQPGVGPELSSRSAGSAEPLGAFASPQLATGAAQGERREPGLHETVRIKPLRAGPLEMRLLLSRRPACRLVIGLRERQTDFAPSGEAGQDALALLRLNLRQEVPELRFWRQGDESPEIVWLCAFESGAEELLERLRREHPRAFVMVSTRDLDETTAQGLKRLGADSVYRLDELSGPRLRERLLAGYAQKRANLRLS
jgi:hypothetical protein